MSGSFSRAATANDLKELIRSLNARGAEYLLIGGYALHAHGYERATTDIDVLVPGRRASGEKIKQTSRDKDAADRAVLERAIRELGKGRP